MKSEKADLMLDILMMPFTNFDFYKNDYFFENKKTETDFKKKEIKEKIYYYIKQKNKIYNLDEINLYMEKFHNEREIEKYKGKNVNLYYYDFLKKLSETFISTRNGKIIFKYWESIEENKFLGPYKGINKILLWNTLNRMIPTDILGVMYIVFNEKDVYHLEGFYHQIILQDLQLETVLKKGISDNHIHASAGRNFYMSWQEVMSLKRETYKYIHEIVSDYDEALLKHTSIIRFLMAQYLSELTDFNFIKYIKECYEKFSEEYDFDISELIIKFYTGETYERDFNFYKISESILGGYKKNLYESKDIIEEFHSKNIKTTSENIFLYDCLDYISKNKDDEWFSKLFFQYLRVKIKFFQMTVQQDHIKGLENFKKYFKRANCIKFNNHWEDILKNQFSDENLKKIELRISIPGKKKDFGIKKETLRSIKDILSAYFGIIENISEEDFKQIGIVFHLIKQKDCNVSDKCWFDYDKEIKTDENFNKLNYGSYIEIYQEKIKIIKEILYEIPNISNYIVGIDAASSENDAEPWVFSSVFKNARDGSFNMNDKNGNKIKSLGFTFHVGEDYRHILTGLRHIDEVIEHFGYHSGDRIGHGICLGTDAKKWCKNNPVVVMPKIEYLENLLWLWGLKYEKTEGIDLNDNYIERKIMEIAEEIYIKMEGITVYSLWSSYRSKFKKPQFDKYKNNDKSFSEKDKKGGGIFCPKTEREFTYSWNTEKLSYSYHCKVYLDRMNEIISVEVNDFIENIIENVQKYVVKKVSKKGIIVETNPTSNGAIGDIEDIFNHYIFNLNGPAGSKNESVMVTINSDDPSVFQTGISSEYSYIFYSLIEKGYSRESALEWIEKIAKYSINTSFIETKSMETVKKEIKEILRLLNECYML